MRIHGQDDAEAAQGGRGQDKDGNPLSPVDPFQYVSIDRPYLVEPLLPIPLYLSAGPIRVMGGEEDDRLEGRGQQGDGHGERDHPEEFPYGSREDHEGEKRGDGGQRPCQYGKDDLVGSLYGGVMTGESLLLEAVAVFRNHDGVVHDEAEDEDKAEQGVAVEGFPESLKDQEGEGKGDGDPQGRHERVPDADEQEEDAGEKEEAEYGVVEEDPDAFFYLYRRISGEGDVDAGPQGLPEGFHLFLDPFDDGYGVSAGDLGYPDGDRFLAVEPGVDTPLVESLGDCSHVTYADQPLARARASAHDHRPEFLGRVDSSHGPQEVFPRLGVEGSSRYGRVLGLDGPDQFSQRETE